MLSVFAGTHATEFLFSTLLDMGFFNKSEPSTKEKAEALAILEAAWEQNPADVVARFIANSPDPLTVLAQTLVILVESAVVSLIELETLGIDAKELSNVISALTSENPSLALHYETAVRNAMVEYEGQIDEILATSGVSLTSELRADFRKALASFAANNSITDLKVAHRLMKAEGVDPLKGFTGNQGPQGYL